MNTKTEQTSFSLGNQKQIKFAIKAVESGLIPDFIIRFGIRRLLKQRLLDEFSQDPQQSSKRYNDFLYELKKSKLAIDTDKANEQHYEIDSEFYNLVLGQNKKYSSCYYKNENESLSTAEKNMLELYIERGQFSDGQNILELGCGWGSLTLYLAKRFPQSHITGVSNSHSQRNYILKQAKDRGLKNIEIITCDINNLSLENQFDRIISIEMFEHVRNYQNLFKNISSWMNPQGLLFIHVFCHRHLMYPFETEGEDNWMGKYFFSGGQMPAADTFLNFQQHLNIEKRWINNGQHYEKTSNHWLENMDENKQQVLIVLKKTYGQDYKLWFQRWRIFFMSCAELFGYNKGNEWLVGHYLFTRR